MSFEPRKVKGRSCKGCTLCCQLPAIAATNSPEGQFCVHCRPERAKGCDIYRIRPDQCREFQCMWRLGLISLDPRTTGVLVTASEWAGRPQIRLTAKTQASLETDEVRGFIQQAHRSAQVMVRVTG